MNFSPYTPYGISPTTSPSRSDVRRWTRFLRAKLRKIIEHMGRPYICLLYTSPSPRDRTRSRMPSSA